MCEEAAVGDADDVVVGAEVGEGRDEEHAVLCLADGCEMGGTVRREGRASRGRAPSRRRKWTALSNSDWACASEREAYGSRAVTVIWEDGQ